MNPAVAKLVGGLKHGEELVQNKAVVQLAMLLEQSVYPEREDAVWRLVLPEELLALRLPLNEIHELINVIIVFVDSGQLSHSSKLSLIGVIARNTGIENAEALLKFFFELAERLSEEEAFSFLAGLAQFLLNVEDQDRLQTLFAKYKTVELLERFQSNASPRLQESARRLLRHLKTDI